MELERARKAPDIHTTAKRHKKKINYLEVFWYGAAFSTFARQAWAISLYFGIRDGCGVNVSAKLNSF